MPKITEHRIQEKIVFEFIYSQNAERVALALCSAGYFVRIVASGSGYLVYVYTDRF